MLDDRTWYHSIDLPDGSTTPGYFDTRAVASSVRWPDGIRGGRCLDVGTFDGFWAFEMERQGAAEVVALDLDDPAALDWTYDEAERGPELVRSWGAERGPGFEMTCRALRSSVTRIDRSVYDLDPEVVGTFDVVFCGALLIHLRDPVRALEAMRTVCDGRLVLVETIDPGIELRARHTPAARFHPGWDQWWRVNTAGLREMVRVAGFEVEWVSPPLLVPHGEGHHGSRPAMSHSLAARQPFQRGVLHRGLRARPRSPSPSR